MSVLSVPLTSDLSKKIDVLVKSGVASNKAELARKAIEFFAEDHAVKMVIQAEEEVKNGKVLSGDLDDLAAKL